MLPRSLHMCLFSMNIQAIEALLLPVLMKSAYLAQRVPRCEFRNYTVLISYRRHPVSEQKQYHVTWQPLPARK